MSAPQFAPARVLVTGATGFVGQAVCRSLLDGGFAVRACLHRGPERVRLAHLHGPIEFHSLGDLAAGAELEGALQGIDTIVHLAARVHVMRERNSNPQAEFRRVNVAATRRLAEAASGRVRRLVFVSSIKVNGEYTIGKPFDEQDPPHPADPYAASKWEAEEALREVGARSGLEVAIVRPPLVYGPGVRANFLRLLDAVYRGMPLPLGYFENRRSLIGIRNLADVLMRCVEHPAAANQTLLACDREDVSTGELIARIAQALDRPCRLLPVPAACVRFAARLAGKRAEAERVLGSLVLNCGKVRELLNWEAPFSMTSGLLETARWYLDLRRGASCHDLA